MAFGFESLMDFAMNNEKLFLANLVGEEMDEIVLLCGFCG